MDRNWLFALLLCLTSIHAQAASLTSAEMLLVGTIVNNAEETEIDAYRLDGDYWIKLQDLAELTGATIEEKGDAIQIVTPIGKATLPRKELSVLDGIEYISDKQLLEKLNIKTVFSDLNFALYFEVPWQPGTAVASTGKKSGKPIAEITAPGSSISFIRTQSDFSNNLDRDNSDSWSNIVDAGGRVGDATWSLGLDQQSEQPTELNRYFWNRVYEHSATRVGTNSFNSSVLLDGQSFTGAQWAYSNKGIEPYTDFETSLNLDSFLREDIDVQQTITRTDGPPGGIAELRINDSPVARVRVGLNGWYEFRNIPQAENKYQSIAIWLYRRNLAEPPLAKLDYTRSVLREMLQKEEVLIRAGGGQSGNALYDDNEEKLAFGFLQGRYGINDRLTLAATIQHDQQGSSTGIIGTRLSLGRHWAFAFDTATNDGSNAYSAELEGISDKWELNMRSLSYKNGYKDNMEDDQYDHYLRTLYQLSFPLRVGLYARSAIDSKQNKIEYVKPGLSINPFRGFLASAIPNLDGDYRVSADYYIQDDTQVSATYENKLYSLVLDRDLREYDYTQIGVDYKQDESQHVWYWSYNWYPFNNYYNSLRTGFSYSGSAHGFSLDWNWVLRPGIEFQLAYSDGYRAYDDEETERVFSASLRMGFTKSGRRFIPTDNEYINFSRGGISGAIYDQDGSKLDVNDVRFKINGKSPPQTQVGGYFALSNLKPGIYSVEIDEANLPIEYVPVKHRYSVEVARSAVTQVDFKVRAEYGVAGQVVDKDGHAIAKAVVQAKDQSGKVVSTGMTGIFGYYRLDGLAPGKYDLVVAESNGTPVVSPAKPFKLEIRDDYLFDRNLVVPDINAVQTDSAASEQIMP